MSLDSTDSTHTYYHPTKPDSTNHFTSAQHAFTAQHSADGAAQPVTASKGKSRQRGDLVAKSPETATSGYDSPVDENEEPEAAVGADMAVLAPELLVRVFSFLDPVSLTRSAAVCRLWALIARDDATWRSAFAVYFNLESASAIGHSNGPTSSRSATTPALRRLVGTSWRQEFQQRFDLLRTWRKSRTPTVLSMPRVDIIAKISLSKQHKFLVSASDNYGVASRSNPWTGKVTKGYLDAEGTANGAGNGNPNVEFSPNVTCLNTAADATAIFWGFRTGEVGITSMSRQGINPRGAVKSHRFSPRACHAGPVTAIAIPFASDSDGAHGPGRTPERLRQAIAGLGDASTTFVTAGFDGTVRLWTSLREWPLWIASTSSVTSNAMSTQAPVEQINAQPAVATPICALAYDAKHGVIVAGTTTGKLVVWSHLDITAFMQIPAEATDPEHARSAQEEPEILQAQSTFQRLADGVLMYTVDVPHGTGSEVAVSSIHIDATPEEMKLLVCHSGARVLLRHHIVHESRRVETTVLGAVIMDEITALRPDFEPRLPKKEVRSSGMQTPSTSNYTSPALAAVGDASTDVPRLVLGPTPFETYTGEGQYSERKYVCAGTKSGSIFLFDWDAPGVPYDAFVQAEWQGHTPARFRGSSQLLPSLGWEAHHTPITAIDMTPLYIIIGTSDGTIKVFDSLAGDLVRTINDRTATKHPARMLAAGEMTTLEAARFRVTQIIADNECLVASIGHQILAFRAEPVLSKRAAAAAAAAAKSKGGRTRLAENKYALQMELKRDVRESKVQLEAENEERQAEYDKYRSRGYDRPRPAYQLEGLSEAESLEYALMLSRDEEAAKASNTAQHLGGAGYVPGSHASSSASRFEPSMALEDSLDDPDLADALEQIALAESKADADNYRPASFESPTPFYTTGKGKQANLQEDHDFPGESDVLDSDFELDDSGSYQHAQTSSPMPVSSNGASRAFSPSPSSSLSTSASRAWTILNQAGGSASSPARSLDRWGQHSKVRTVHVPASARISSPPLQPSNSLECRSGELLAIPQIASPNEFPAITPLSLSPRASSPSSIPSFSRRASTAALESPTTGRMGKWNNKSPVLQPTRQPSAWKVRPTPQSTTQEDSDLLLAIQLSLTDQ